MPLNAHSVQMPGCLLMVVTQQGGDTGEADLQAATLRETALTVNMAPPSRTGCVQLGSLWFGFCSVDLTMHPQANEQLEQVPVLSFDEVIRLELMGQSQD